MEQEEEEEVEQVEEEEEEEVEQGEEEGLAVELSRIEPSSSLFSSSAHSSLYRYFKV